MLESTREQELERENAELRKLVQWMYVNWAYSIDGYYCGLLDEAKRYMEKHGCELDGDAE